MTPAFYRNFCYRKPLFASFVVLKRCAERIKKQVAHFSVLSATVVRARGAGTNNYLLVDIISPFDMISKAKLSICLYQLYGSFMNFI